MVINFYTKPTLCSVVNLDNFLNDSNLFQFLDLVSFDNRMYSFKPFWGLVLTTDEIQKANPRKVEIPDLSIREKIIPGSRVKIGVLDLRFNTRKFIWLTVLSRSLSPEGPIYSAFVNQDELDLGIKRFSFMPFVRPSYILDIDMHDLVPDGETDFDVNFKKLTTYEQKRFIEFFMEYKNIPATTRTQVRQQFY